MIIFLSSRMAMYPNRAGVAIATDAEDAINTDPDATAMIHTTYIMSIRKPRQKTLIYFSMKN